MLYGFIIDLGFFLECININNFRVVKIVIFVKLLVLGFLNMLFLEFF